MKVGTHDVEQESESEKRPETLCPNVSSLSPPLSVFSNVALPINFRSPCPITLSVSFLKQYHQFPPQVQKAQLICN